ncbi:uncharacterized protein ACNLHF_011949 [Anomaloglossus baeobatrachus]
MSKYQTVFYPADSNMRSDGMKRRLDTVFQKLFEKKYMDMKQKIVMIEEDIKNLNKVIEENTIELDNIHQPLENITEEETQNKIQLIMTTTTTMKNFKQTIIKKFQEQKEELNTLENALWIHKIQSTPQAFSPYKFQKVEWSGSLNTIQEETTEHEDEDEKVVNGGSMTRLQRFLAWFCCWAKNLAWFCSWANNWFCC